MKEDTQRHFKKIPVYRISMHYKLKQTLVKGKSTRQLAHTSAPRSQTKAMRKGLCSYSFSSGRRAGGGQEGALGSGLTEVGRGRQAVSLVACTGSH
jgi:hypothetical protein